MLIGGFQKLTLLDFPGRVACTVFTVGCNFRCPFCHNSLLVTNTDKNNVWDEDEVLSFINKRAGVLDGVAITGGEPTLMPDLPDFIRKIKDMGLDVKLDTNGTSPEILESLIDAGLVDYVAMDIKSSVNGYSALSGVDVDIAPIEKSIGILMQRRVPYEFRTTAVRELHTLDDFKDIGEMIRGADKYFIQKYVDSGACIKDGFSAFEDGEMREILGIVQTFVPNAELRGL